jgi:undecaprenyl-diphosphatase
VSWWSAILLGLIQGLTEFLPVSSSGHLALVQMLVPGFEQPGVVVDAMLHLGTAAAVVFHERRNLVRWLTSRSGWRLGLLLVLASIATAVIAFPLLEPVHDAFESPLTVGICLLVTGAVVLLSRRLQGGDGDENRTTWRQALIVGVVQGLAVFPGISRSGTTITAGLACGLDRAWAARFSFLLGVPAIAGAALVELISEREALATVGGGYWALAALGAVVAGVAGYLALRVVIATLQSRMFHRFGWYCLALGLVVLAIASRWPA